MYIAEFIFEPGDRDEEFARLNAMIDDAARSSSGFLGAEVWQLNGGTKINATYYWQTFEALEEFSIHPVHMEAKRQYRKWYNGFHIVITKLMRSYGDGAFSHLTPNDRNRT